MAVQIGDDRDQDEAGDRSLEADCGFIQERERLTAEGELEDDARVDGKTQVD